MLKHLLLYYFPDLILTVYFHFESDGVLHIFKVVIQVTTLISLIMVLLSPWRDAVIIVVIRA